MALISCPGCGRQISEYARKCPGCGFSLLPEPAALPEGYPPEWPDDLRRVLPWSALYFGFAAALLFLLFWLIREPDLVPCWVALGLACIGVGACAAGAVFRSRAVLLAAAAAFLGACVLGFFFNLAAGILSLLAVLPLTVFLLLEAFRLRKIRKGVI